MANVRAVAYCRVSSKSDESANSLQNQREELQYILSEMPDVEYLGEYVDYGVSGTKLKRDGFNRMLQDAGLEFIIRPDDEGDTRNKAVKYIFHARGSATQPKFDLILCKDTSRFARSLAITDIITELIKKRVYIHFLDIDKRTDRPNDIVDINTHLTAADSESRLRSSKVNFGLKVSKRKNRIHTNGKLYGYIFDKQTNSLTAIPEEAAIVQRIYNMYESGLGLRKIAMTLSDEGISTRNGKRFSENVISQILHQEKYTGVNNRMKRIKPSMFTNGQSVKMREGYEADLVENDRIEQIITVEQFNECKRLFESKTSHQTLKGIYSGNSEYASMLICGRCGAAYHCNSYQDNHSKNSKYRSFYNCSTRKKLGAKACDNPLINKEDIDNFIAEFENGRLLEQLEYDREQTIEKLNNLAFMFMQKLDTDNTARIAELQAVIEQLKFEEGNVYRLYRKSGRDDDLAEVEQIRAEIQSRQAVLDEMNMPNTEVINMIQQILSNIDSIKAVKFIEHDWMLPDGDTYESITFRRDEVLSYIEKIVIQATDSVIETKKKKRAAVNFKMDTTRKYRQYIETFGHDLDRIRTFTDEEKAYLLAKYNTLVNL